MRLIYSLVYLLAHIIILPREYLKRPAEARGRWLREKLGGPEAPSPEPAGKTLWVHAVSVGEAIAASDFIAAFRDRHPGYRVIISTVTDTGQAVARERLGGIAKVIYLPLDLGIIFSRAVRLHRPTLFVNMETELWPNMFRSLDRAGVPIVLLNGRISDKSFKGYMRIRPLLRGLLGRVALYCMQDELYARRIIGMGADEGRVTVTGSLKFDMKKPVERALTWPGLIAGNGPMIVAGSTHRGEEELVADAYMRLVPEVVGLRLVLAPRHPERCDAVAAMLKLRGIPFVRRSAIADGATAIDAAVVLLDTVGELSSVYKSAGLVIIGGSFIPHGGQNPLEPAYWGKTVLCGPNMWNFPFVKEFIERGAVIATTGEGLREALLSLLKDPERREAIGSRARELMMKNQGATARALNEIERRVGV